MLLPLFSFVDQFFLQPIHVSRSLLRHLGSLLGEHNVNIASMQVGRRIVRGDAVMVLSIDDPIPPALLATINGINGIQEAHPVTL